MASTETETPERHWTLQGNAARMIRSKARELLLESGAGTSKTFSLLIKADKTAWDFPGCRQLFIRRTRISMNQAPLPEWESEILWPGHPAFSGPGATGHFKDRQFYNYGNGPNPEDPRQGASEIWLAGFDSKEKINDILSSKWDKVYAFQCEQLRLDDVEAVISRLRNFGCALRDEAGEIVVNDEGKAVESGHQVHLDVNPAHPEHWIAKRFGLVRGTGRWDTPKGKAVFSYRHTDNPMLFDAKTKKPTPQGHDYVGETLEALTGHRRQRLLLHRWVQVEGAIWPDYDPDKHVLYGATSEKHPEALEPTNGNQSALLRVQGWKRPVELRWFMGSFDWGWEDPATFQCWGFDSKNRAYLVAEEYRQHLGHEAWAELIEEIHERHRMRVIVCDHEPALIDAVNRRLGSFYADRGVGGIARNATKVGDRGERVGLDIVRERFRKRKDGTYGIYMLSDALRSVDADLAPQPQRLTDEIPSYVYREKEEGKAWKEEPDPTCVDHGCDALRYMAVWAWGKDLAPKPEEGPETTVPLGTMGHQYEKSHRDALKRLGKPKREEKRRW